MQERRGQQEIAPKPRVQLGRLAADRRDPDRVLEQPAGVAVVPVRHRGKEPELPPHRGVAEESVDGCAKPRVRDLAGEELQEAVELVCVPAKRRGELSRVGLRGLDRPDLELEPVTKPLDSPQHVDGVALGEARIEQIDVVPDSCIDSPGWVDELEREIGSARTRAQPLLARHCVRPLDDAVFGQLGERAHVVSLTLVADVRSFRALRYDEANAGPLETLVAPPYDVISDEERREYLAKSPYNIVHLTLPDSEEQAARDLRSWRDEDVLSLEEPGVWTLSQTYVGPDRIERTRNGLVVALRLEPYENQVVLPHERTHAGPKEGRLRLLRSTRTQLEPIFLLHDGDPVELPSHEPDLQSGGDRLWRIEADLGSFADAQLLIADGHHRYETALAFHEEDGTEASAFMMVVLVSTREEGLTIFPTHRVVTELNGVPAKPIPEPGDELPGLVLYRDGGYALVEGEGLDVEVVDALRPEGVTYTPQRAEAVAAVDRGEAEVAFLLRPTRIEDVFTRAREGRVMPQKTTYFYPKLTSGLLLQPLD